MFPIFPLVSAILVATGGVGLYWYDCMSRDEREKADRMAAELALELYETSVRNLTREQANHVAAVVRQRMLG